MTDRTMVSKWLADYEAAWRAPGTEGLAGIFTSDATYLHSPYEKPIVGLDEISRTWDEERDGPDEVLPSVPAFLPSTALLQWYAPRSAMGTRSGWSTATCGSYGCATTVAAIGSRSGLTGQGVPILPATTPRKRSLI